MKKQLKKMSLAKETLRSLEIGNRQLGEVAGATRADTECVTYGGTLCGGDSKYC